MKETPDNKDLADFERDLRALVPREAKTDFDQIAEEKQAQSIIHFRSFTLDRMSATRLATAWTLGLAAGIAGTLLCLRFADPQLQQDGAAASPTTLAVDSSSNGQDKKTQAGANTQQRHDENSPLSRENLHLATAYTPLPFASEPQKALTPMSLYTRVRSANQGRTESETRQKGNGKQQRTNSRLASESPQTKAFSTMAFAKPGSLQASNPQTQRDMLRSMIGGFESF